MARKETQITIDDQGTELDFIIKQMPASQAEEWAAKVALLLIGSNMTVPDGAGLGEAARSVAANGLAALSSLRFDDVKPLLDELLTCVDRVIEGGKRMPVNMKTIDGYISNPLTIIKLRAEAFKANLDFFGYGDLLTSLPQLAASQAGTPST